MGKNLSYVILNILTLFTTGQIFDPTHYTPNCEIRSVVISRIVNTSSDRIRIPVVSKLTLSGFHFAEIEVDKAILANAISFLFAFSSEVKDLINRGRTEVGKLSDEKILLVK